MPIVYQKCLTVYKNYNKNRKGKPVKTKPHASTQISTSFVLMWIGHFFNVKR